MKSGEKKFRSAYDTYEQSNTFQKQKHNVWTTKKKNNERSKKKTEKMEFCVNCDQIDELE